MDEQLNPAGATGSTGGARGVPDPGNPHAAGAPGLRDDRPSAHGPRAGRPQAHVPWARGPWGAIPTGALAAATLVVAFAAAQGTGVRALGGAVLGAGVVWCAWRSLPAAGAVRVAAVVVLGAVCFVASHLLAPHLGAWPSVALVAAVLGGGAWLLVDRRRPAD
jgi:hypothetical protein